METYGIIWTHICMYVLTLAAMKASQQFWISISGRGISTQIVQSTMAARSRASTLSILLLLALSLSSKVKKT